MAKIKINPVKITEAMMMSAYTQLGVRWEGLEGLGMGATMGKGEFCGALVGVVPQAMDHDAHGPVQH